MVKAHNPINWENEPSFNTPINEVNLNKMDSTIGILDDRIIEQDTVKLDKSVANTMVKDISLNESTGIFTVTLLNGSTTTIDTKLEKISINFDYNKETQQIEIILDDGTKQYIDISSLISPIDFVDSDEIGWEVTSDWKVKAKVLDGSITEDMLQPNYLAEIKVETAKSAQSMANAQISENSAKQSELNAKESEEKALEYSNNAQPLSQSVSGNNPTASNSTDGNLIYLKDAGYTEQKTLSGKNLLDKDNTTYKTGLTFNKDTYSFISGNNSPRVYYMECLPNTTYTYSKSIGSFCRFGSCQDIPSINVPISVMNNDTNAKSSTITTSENDKYLAFYPLLESEITDIGFDSVLSSIQIELGETATNYEPYCGGIASPNPDYPQEIKGLGDSGTIEVKTCGKNVKDCYNVTWRGNGDTAFTKENGVIAITRFANVYSGIYTHSLFKGLDHLIDKKMVLSLMAKTDTSGMSIKVATNGKSVSTELTTSYQKVSLSFTYTGSKELTIYGNALAGNVYIKDMQLELGEVATDYEPHQETTALIPVSAPFYDGDYMEVYADGSGQIVRSMASETLDTSRTWKKGYNVNSYYTELPTAKRAIDDYNKGNVIGKCDKFTFAKSYMVAKVGNVGLCGFGDNTTSTVVAFNTGHTSLAEFTTWLTDNPLHVVYELAEPTSTPLKSEQVAEFMKLQTFKGVTHVNADGEVTVRYYVDNASGDTVEMLSRQIANSSVEITPESIGAAKKINFEILMQEEKTIDIPNNANGGFLVMNSDMYESSAHMIIRNGSPIQLSESTINGVDIGQNGDSTFVILNASVSNINASLLLF